jgi:ribonucleoside-diphosphate reductase alpha chain
MVNCGSIFTTVNLPLEVIIRMGKAGGCQHAWIEAVGRLISLSLQYGVPVEEIVLQLKGIRCPGAGAPKGGPGQSVLSCPDAIAKDLERSVAPVPEDMSVTERQVSIVHRDSQSDSIA